MSGNVAFFFLFCVFVPKLLQLLLRNQIKKKKQPQTSCAL